MAIEAITIHKQLLTKASNSRRKISSRYVPLTCMMELIAEAWNVSMHAGFRPVRRSPPLKSCILACPAARGLNGVPSVIFRGSTRRLTDHYWRVHKGFESSADFIYDACHLTQQNPAAHCKIKSKCGAPVRFPMLRQYAHGHQCIPTIRHYDASVYHLDRIS